MVAASHLHLEQSSRYASSLILQTLWQLASPRGHKQPLKKDSRLLLHTARKGVSEEAGNPGGLGVTVRLVPARIAGSASNDWVATG